MAFRGRLFLVRHPETHDNKEGLIQGQQDSPLTTRGRLQALKIAEYLKGTSLSAIFSSDLNRAAETARIVSSNISWQIPLIYDRRLREIGFGGYEKQPVRLFSEDPRRVLETSPQNGGESLRHCYCRVKSFMDDLLMSSDEKDIAIITHYIIKIMLLRVMIPSFAKEVKDIPNGAISIIQYRGGIPSPLTINLVTHLR